MGGEEGRGPRRWVKMETVPVHCPHQTDFSVKMGICVNHFNVSLIVKRKGVGGLGEGGGGKFTRQCP